MRRIARYGLGLTAALCIGAGCERGASMAPARSPRAEPPLRSQRRAKHRKLPVAHWVLRIAPTPFSSLRMSDTATAPVRNNYGTAATTYLGNRRGGALLGGRRVVFDGGQLTPVAASATTPALEAVLQIPPGLGGGFVFSGATGLFWSSTFDGSLRQVSPDGRSLEELAPHALVLSSPSGLTLVSTDGKPVAGAPSGMNLDRVFAHRRGLAVLSASDAGRAWVTSDGRKLTELGIGAVRDAVEDGDTLLVFTDSSSFRVDANGATPSKLSPEEAGAKKLRYRRQPHVPDDWGQNDAFEGAFFDAGWIPTGRNDDEWVGLRDGQLYLAHTAPASVKPVGEKLSDDGGCGLVAVDAEPLVLCAIIGARLSVYRVDLSSGATSLEREIKVTRGAARHMGMTEGVFPRTLMITATCEGDADAGFCVRDAEGGWKSHSKPPVTTAQLLAFPGELFVRSYDAQGDVLLRGPGPRETRRFSADELKAALAPLGPATSYGFLRTPSGIREFYGPNPLEPIVNAESFAVDWPLDPASAISVERHEGVVATAGEHALRLANGKLFESDDGWRTWFEVPAPPTGAPKDLAGAMCDEYGCVLGPWARIGWAKYSD